MQTFPGANVGIAAGKTHGLFSIDDAIRQYRNWSKEQWETEAECRRPVLKGMVYQSFNQDLHVVNDLDFDDNLPTYRAIDWGLNNFVCLWIQLTKYDQVRVIDEYWTQQATVRQAARDILAHDGHRWVLANYCDPAGASRSDQTGLSDKQVFRQEGIPCTSRRGKKVQDLNYGINIIRAYLNPNYGSPRLKIAGRCTGLIRAFESYRLREVNGQPIDEPIKPQPCDHPMDALRYFFVNRLPVKDEVKHMGYSG